VSVTAEIVDRLLYEEEDSSLDFKQDQYPFAGASDDDKSELLKDILAFANAWRRTDAYILVGIKEVRGSRSIVVGVANHLDDAHLQQFVNSKTQQPVHFSYQALEFEGKLIGVIHIPTQIRPIYITRNYGGLQKEVVYVRRGSSTDKASPEEIAKMGAAMVTTETAAPLLDVQFVDTERGALLGKSINVKTEQIEIPDEQSIPDYGVRVVDLGLGMRREFPDFNKNSNYFRDIAKYYKVMSSVYAVNFAVKNDGIVLAGDVRLEISIDDSENKYIFLDADGLPNEPSKWPFQSTRIGPMDPDVTVNEFPESWVVTATLGKIQPKRTKLSQSALYVGARESCQIKLSVTVYADNLPSPRNIILTIDVDVNPKEVTIAQLIDE
jgi:hypothetical protein